MWDLDTLRYLNEQAYLRQRMINGEPIGESEFKIEPVFPLSNLARKLIVGPPSLSRLADLISNYESVADFLELVREFLPERETAIMSQVDNIDKMRSFSHYFNNKYFPLSDSDLIAYDDFELSDFTRYIPVDLFGFSYDDYHGFVDNRQGLKLLMALIESPWDDNARIPILEEAVSLVGKDLVELIPIGGVGLEEIHRMLDETKYEGVSAVADWIHSATECWQLNATYEEYEGEFWSHHVVDNLTLQWPQVTELQNKMVEAYTWLEEDIHKNFAELLYFLLDLEQKPFVVPKEQLPLPI
ncbi:hypothetical protein ES703_74780 [subsurface metagenome]